MGYTRNSKGTQTYEKKGRKIIATDVAETTLPNNSSLNNAIKDQRSPNISEIIDELKCLLGVALVSLRNSNDVYRLVQALGQATRAVGTISAMEKVEDLTPDMLKSMSTEEIKQYVMKQLDALN